MLVNATCSEPAEPGVGRRRDYHLLADRLDAEVLDLAAVHRSRLGRLLLRAGGPYVALAVLGLIRTRRGGIDVVLCDNENEAVVLTVLGRLLRRRTPLVTLCVSPAARKKLPLLRLGAAAEAVDLWLNHSSVQAERLKELLAVPPERVQVLPYHADTLFFAPERVAVPGVPVPVTRPYVLAVGRQHRDYDTLIAAAVDLSVDVVIDAGSLFSRWPDTLMGRPLPPSVHLVSLDADQLRAAYAGAAVVVVPTEENDFGAGGTTILEGMAMARPVVATRTHAGGDLLADRRSVLRCETSRSTLGLFGALFAAQTPDAGGPHGLYVPPGDVVALRGALQHVLDHPDEAAELGRRGRALVAGALDLDRYVDRVVAAVEGVAAGRSAG